MPANHNSSKGFKKGKKWGSYDERASTVDARTTEQDYGRVLRMLGNRRVVLYCNDGIERTCKIRGALCRGPKKQIISVGDVVLFSLRSFDGGSSDDGAQVGIHSKSATSGDIILKYESNQWRTLRKEDGVNPNLFVDATVATAAGKQPIDDIFESDVGAIEEETTTQEDDAIDIDRI